MEKYYTYRGIKKNGPYSLNELKGHIIYPDSKIWKEGAEEWTIASELKELENFIQVKPPPRIKPLSYFNNNRQLKIKFAIPVTIILYLFIALFFKNGFNALMIKFNYREQLDDVTLNLSGSLQRKLREEFDEKQFVYVPNTLWGSEGNNVDPYINILPTLNSIISTAFIGISTIVMTVIIFIILIAIGNFQTDAFRKYLNQYWSIVK